MADDDDEGYFGGLYEEGHWIWDDNSRALLFVSDRPPKTVEAVQLTTKAPTGAIEFRDDVDLIEQIRYRRRYQRKLKLGQHDIITLQDVKDLAIYTAPVNFLSPVVINMLHLPTTERFLRALILCCQYYLQVADEVASRILELDSKVRTLDCDIIEKKFSENLSDLRLLAAKEYCVMLIGGADTKKFHHMGAAKKRRSLSDKDARFYETLLRMSAQIVWLALGRKSFHQIELEINRIFKSEIFNAVEHTLKTEYIAKMVPEERAVLLGQCVRHDKKLNTRSPLINEVFCQREIDYRLVGLGVVRSPPMSPRHMYMWRAVAGPEEHIAEKDVVLGIIGLPRSMFDTMLRPLPTASSDAKSKLSLGSRVGSGSGSSSIKKSASTPQAQRLYPEIILPPKSCRDSCLPPTFPAQTEPIHHVSETQRLRWLKRLYRLLHPEINRNKQRTN